MVRYISISSEAQRYTSKMQGKIFWATFILLSVIADIMLPLVWGLLVTIPIAIGSWWFAYRSGWF